MFLGQTNDSIMSHHVSTQTASVTLAVHLLTSCEIFFSPSGYREILRSGPLLHCDSEAFHVLPNQFSSFKFIRSFIFKESIYFKTDCKRRLSPLTPCWPRRHQVDATRSTPAQICTGNKKQDWTLRKTCSARTTR